MSQTHSRTQTTQRPATDVLWAWALIGEGHPEGRDNLELYLLNILST